MTLRSALVIGLAACLPSALLAADNRPNIIVIVADDLGYADLGVHGNKEIATPNIDSLAANGVRCTNGYVSCPYCSPTRAGLLTGRYQQRFGHEFNPARLQSNGAGQGLSLNETTIADRLKEAGYATGLVGKWHQGEEEKFHPMKRGFGEFFGFLPGAHGYLRSDDKVYGPIMRGHEKVEINGYLTDVLGREAAAFIDRHKEKPFFIYLAFNAVHTPMHAREDLLKKVQHIKDEKRRTYLTMLLALDEAVGNVLAKLKETKLDERTLLFFISDNGGPTTKFAANGSRNDPLRGSKGDTWEGGIRVPFLVQWKGKLPAGKEYAQPVISLDITATSLAAAGVAIKPEWKLDGVNLLPYLEGKSSEAPHAALFWRFGTQMAVRSGDWKLVRGSRGPKEYDDIAPEPLLFNLKNDISEKNDLAKQHPDKVKEMQTSWERWNAELPKPAWPATVMGKAIKP